SSLFQYPFITCGPRTAISPASPTGNSSSVPSLTIIASVSGHGTPILPLIRFSQSKLACVTGDDSVNPYPSTNLPLVTFSYCCCTSTCIGAEPLIHPLI